VILGVGLAAILLVAGTLIAVGLAEKRERGKHEDASVSVRPVKLPRTAPPPQPAPVAIAPIEEPAALPVPPANSLPALRADELAPLPQRQSPTPAAEAAPTLPKPAPVAAPFAVSKYAREEEYRLGLAAVPELALHNDWSTETAAAARKRLTTEAQQIKKQIATDPDAFVKELIAKRTDLAGLPFRMGKDCKLDKAQAQALDQLSRHIRDALDFAVRRSASTVSSHIAPDPARFWQGLGSALRNHRPQAPMQIPALQQLLLAEHAGMRLSFVERLRDRKDKEATDALARRAVFDLEGEVRAAALSALKDRPQTDYADILFDALRYPWPPVVDRAVEAIVELKVHGAADRLARLLDEPEPTAPFVREVGGKAVPHVRELVRINHFRNCLLCHAPASGDKDLVRGVVPVPGEPLPSGFRAYYAERRAVAVVRADVTYLRQDFSVTQPVVDHSDWPQWQRFDYLVRTRPLTKAETNTWEARQKQASPALTGHKQTLLAALRTLTGMDAAPTTRDWQRALSAMAERPERAWPIDRARTCTK